MAGNAIFTIVSFWLLNFLTDSLRLRPELAGTALLVGRIWDAVTDPVMGWISDRTRSRWGRRRPYLVAGGVATAVSLVVLFLPVRFASQPLLFLWAAASYSLLCTAYTVLMVPYSSLTPELTKDYRERTELNGYRMTSAVTGTLLGAGAFLPILSLFPRGPAAWPLTAGVFGLLTVCLSFVTFFSVKEKPSDRDRPPAAGPFRDLADAFSNRTFRILLGSWTLNMTAVTVVSGMFVYYFRHVLRSPSLTTAGLLTLLLTAFALLPVWVVLGRKIPKHAMYAAGLILLAISICLIFFFGMTPLAVILLLIPAGAGLAGTYAAPGALIPDVVEEDSVRTGRRREGIYYGVWTFSAKVGQALASLLMGWGLAATGYSAGAEHQSASSVEGIRWMAGPVPALILAAAALLLFRYPLNREKYERMMGVSRVSRGRSMTL